MGFDIQHLAVVFMPLVPIGTRTTSCPCHPGYRESVGCHGPLVGPCLSLLGATGVSPVLFAGCHCCEATRGSSRGLKWALIFNISRCLHASCAYRHTDKQVVRATPGIGNQPGAMGRLSALAYRSVWYSHAHASVEHDTRITVCLFGHSISGISQ